MEPNLHSRELAEYIQLDLAGRHHRFEIPVADDFIVNRVDSDDISPLRFMTANEVTAKAEELGVKEFIYIEPDGTRRTFSQNREDWISSNKKTLENVQQNIDYDSLYSIQARGLKRNTARQSVVDPEIDRLMLQADTLALRCIQDESVRQKAFTQIMKTACLFPTYKQALETEMSERPVATIRDMIANEITANNTKGNEYCGVIIHMDAKKFLQQTDKGIVCHNASDVSGRLKIGQNVTVNYNYDSVGIVKTEPGKRDFGLRAREIL